MMDCTNVRELLLEADLDEVSPELESHLDGCEACAGLLERLLGAEEALGRELETVAASVAPEIDPAAVRAAEAGRTRSPVRWRVMVPLAAAAVVSGIAFFGPRTRPAVPFEVPDNWETVHTALSSTQPVVDSKTHDNIVVMPTKNPDITVVWLMD